jgi:hypothetical protein
LLELEFEMQEDPVVDNDAVTQNPEKDPTDWVTGDEPATGPQQSYLSTLAQQAGEQVETTELTKAEASQKIDELQEQTGR